MDFIYCFRFHGYKNKLQMSSECLKLFLGTVLFLTVERLLRHIEYLAETLAPHVGFVFRSPPLSQV